MFKYQAVRRGAAIAAVLAVALLAGCDQVSSKETGPVLSQADRSITVYAPTWLPFTGGLPGYVNEAVIAFAEPNEEGGITLPVMESDYLHFVARAHFVALGIGGWGASNARNEELRRNWATAQADPAKFAASVQLAIEQLNEQGIHITTVDFDYEYPRSEAEATGVAALMKAVRDLTNRGISIAVSASPTGAPYTAATFTHADMVRVMAYDEPATGLSDSSQLVLWAAEWRNWFTAHPGAGRPKMQMGFHADCRSDRVGQEVAACVTPAQAVEILARADHSGSWGLFVWGQGPDGASPEQQVNEVLRYLIV